MSHPRSGLPRGIVILVLLVVALVGCGDAAHREGAATSATPSALPSTSSQPPSHGWAIGDNGTIVATSDGGASWRVQRANKLDDLSAIDFADSAHGWVVGVSSDRTRSPRLGGIVLVTSDGGATWQPRDVGVTTVEWPIGVDFVDAHHGWIVGTNGLILATSDGGVTWTHQAAPEGPIGADGYWGYDVKFLDTQHGWAAGGSNTDGGVILATADGGATWEAQKFEDSGRYIAEWTEFYAVAFDSPEVGFAKGGHDYATTNGGVTWNRVGRRSGWADDVTFPSDGRSTWKSHKLGKHLRSAGGYGRLFFSDADHGWIVGGDGHGGPRVAVTKDGGATWKLQHIEGDFELVDVTFNDATPQAAD